MQSSQWLYFHATLCAGGDETDWYSFTLTDALKLAWDPGSTTIDAYNNMRNAANTRFPSNGVDFHAAAQINGASR